MRFRAFQGLRPAPESAPKVASLPYDVVNTDEARMLAAGNPLSMLNVVRAEIAFDHGHDPYADEVYARSAEVFKRMQSEGALVRESEPCLYIYRQIWGKHIQHGIVGVCHIEDYEKDVIKKHEKTRRLKEDDRTRLTAELSANTGPVFLTCQDNKELGGIVAKTAKGAPIYDFTADDGIRHTVWRITGASSGGRDITTIFGKIPCAYVADGHHRSASAARVGSERRAANPAHTGEEDYNWFLSVVFPASELKILPYNRYVKDTYGWIRPMELLQAVEQIGELVHDDNPNPRKPGEICMFLGGSWFRITLKPDAGADPVSRLDVSMLQERILGPLLNIDDPRTNERIEFIGGIRGTEELENLVAHNGGVAFSMYPTTVQQLMDIADAGQIMPPKSTWFEPKLRSGLFVHTF